MKFRTSFLATLNSFHVHSWYFVAVTVNSIEWLIVTFCFISSMSTKFVSAKNLKVLCSFSHSFSNWNIVDLYNRSVFEMESDFLFYRICTGYWLYHRVMFAVCIRRTEEVYIPRELRVQRWTIGCYFNCLLWEDLGMHFMMHGLNTWMYPYHPVPGNNRPPTATLHTSKGSSLSPACMLARPWRSESGWWQ